jgi:hypothetical protein
MNAKNPQFGVRMFVDGFERWVPVTFDDVPLQASSNAPKAPCGCQKGAGAALVDVDVVGVQKTETVVAGRGRLVSGTAVGEPLLAVAEPDGDRVACCGGACEGAGTPNAVVFDRYSAREGGGYAIQSSMEHAFPKKLADTYASRSRHCLPWVRVTRDPEAFRGCLAAARALGPIRDSKKVAELMGDYLIKQDQEVFLVILLDTQLQCRGISEIARGSRDRVDVPTPDVLRIAIVDGASAIIVVHNHPSGVNKPSESDIALTETIKRACKEVQIGLMDHVILAGNRYYSFADHGKLKK